jgi:glutaminyl-peptide cyclotransferase
VLRLDVLERHPHDTTAFTEGLVISGGRLFESTGLNGSSTIREVELDSGRVVRQTKLADDQFGEGLAAVGDKLVQLTWRNGVAIAWDRETLAEVRRFSYKGEGWGLCYDEPRRRLVQSDGSSELTFRNPDDFSVIGKVSVSRRGRSLDQINELECSDDGVWANVWHSDQIVRIDPGSGRVTAEVDAKALAPANRGSEDVLNGIARRPDGTWLVTGKNWPTVYVARFAS